MDQIKSALGKVGGSSGGSSTGNNAGATGGQEDYGDKGLDAAEKKFGMNAESMRGTNEKITDGAREQFEKSTGKNVPAKFSN